MRIIRQSPGLIEVEGVAPSTLQAVKETYKKEGTLLPAMERFVLRKATENAGSRRPDVMHPSEMCKPDWCPKRDFYRITLGERLESKKASFTSELIFAEGHTIHDKYQDWLHGMGVLYGMWACRECGHHWKATSPEECAYCSSPRIRYREVPLEDEFLLVAGHADAGVLESGVWLPDPFEPVLVEIKSVGTGTVRMEQPDLHTQFQDGVITLEEMWDRIKRPFPSHLRQATLYCWLTKGQFNKMVFIYERKWNQRTKEFLVAPNYTHIQWILDSAKDVAQAIRAGMEPERPWWGRQDHKTCKACPYRAECWGEQDENAAPKPKVKRAQPARRRKALRPS